MILNTVGFIFIKEILRYVHVRYFSYINVHQINVCNIFFILQTKQNNLIIIILFQETIQWTSR